MKEIITIQHAESEQHLNGMVGSWTDWPLTAKGRRMAENVGRNLKPYLDGKEWVMYSSDLLRTKQTAECAGAPSGLTPILRRELREHFFGEACGKTMQWFYENIRPVNTVDDRMFEGAETWRELLERVRPFAEEILASPDEHVIVVAHCDSLRAFHAIFLGLTPEDSDRIRLYAAPAGVSFLSVDEDGRRIINRLGDLSYAVKEAD